MAAGGGPCAEMKLQFEVGNQFAHEELTDERLHFLLECFQPTVLGCLIHLRVLAHFLKLLRKLQ